MSTKSARSPAGVAAIVARIPAGEAAAEMAARLESSVAGFGQVSERSHADIVRGLRRSLSRWTRFLSTGVMPTEADFEPLRAWARSRAEEGVRLEQLLRSFGLLHELGWQLLRRHARPEEQAELVELAGLLTRYVAQVSAVVTETYMAERELLVSEEERETRDLLEALCGEGPLGARERELAERLGVSIEAAYVPFALALPGAAPHRHAAVAARLRRAGVRVAVTHGESVFGVSARPLSLADVGDEGEALLALGQPTPRPQLAAARDELGVLLEHARSLGLRGELRAQDHLLEMIIGRSPRLLARLRERIFAPLAGEERAELALTLRTLVECRFERAAASNALHVHRNTLAYRLRRIEQLSGLDLTSPRDLACVYVATLAPPPPG